MSEELDRVRRLVLPHPDAPAGGDRGCGCDLVSTEDAAREVVAERDRLQAELDQQRATTIQVAERLCACSEVLGKVAERKATRHATATIPPPAG